jgi:mono/diheme cytochrome c family protein
MTPEIRLSRAGAERPRLSSLVAVGGPAIRDQVLCEAGGPSCAESSAREVGSRRASVVARRNCLLCPLLLVLFLWFGVVSGQEMGSEKKWEAPVRQAQRKNPVPANESSLAAGRKTYLKRCAACHGKIGNGDGPDAVDLGLHPAKFSDPKLNGESDGALFWKITSGKKPMPDYGRRLSPTDRWNVINFLRTLTRRQAR